MASHASPRFQAVSQRAADLQRIAAALGAYGVALCGSVARGEDGPDSDIDFYVHDFRVTGTVYDRIRANELVGKFRQALAPFDVDIRGIPGWLLSDEAEASMRADSLPLSQFTPQ